MPTYKNSVFKTDNYFRHEHSSSRAILFRIRRRDQSGEPSIPFLHPTLITAINCYNNGKQ